MANLRELKEEYNLIVNVLQHHLDNLLFGFINIRNKMSVNGHLLLSNGSLNI